MLKKCFQSPELRTKLLYTMLILVLFRFGAVFSVPFTDSTFISLFFGNTGIFSYLDMVSGGALSNLSIFALGISPYINASIIMQLLCVSFDSLAKMRREEQEKYQMIMQILTVILAVIMAAGLYALLYSYSAIEYTSGVVGVFAAIVIITMFVAGAQTVLFLAYQIDDYGIGNGVSLIIFAGIISSWDSIITVYQSFVSYLSAQSWFYVVFLGALPLMAVLAIYFTVFISNSERHVPVQYSNARARGRASFIPVKLIMSGVLPIIFASSFMGLPQTISMFMTADDESWLYTALSGFDSSNIVYCIIYIVLIFLFNYFYIEVQFDVIEIANNLRASGGTIPGVRSGEPTMKYLRNASSSVAFLGSCSLAMVAAMPILFSNISGLSVQLGGTSLLIVCGVILECMNVIDSYIVIRHQKGFL